MYGMSFNNWLRFKFNSRVLFCPGIYYLFGYVFYGKWSSLRNNYITRIIKYNTVHLSYLYVYNPTYESLYYLVIILTTKLYTTLALCTCSKYRWRQVGWGQRWRQPIGTYRKLGNRSGTTSGDIFLIIWHRSMRVAPGVGVCTFLWYEGRRLKGWCSNLRVLYRVNT